MTSTEKYLMLLTMRAYGGGFVNALSEAWSRADATNDERLMRAFPDYVHQYGPGSAFYEAVAKREAA